MQHFVAALDAKASHESKSWFGWSTLLAPSASQAALLEFSCACSVAACSKLGRLAIDMY